MPRDRRKYFHDYYKKNKSKWKGYIAGAIAREYGRSKISYKKLTNKQKKFKRAVDQGIDPIEAIKIAYPGSTHTHSGLSQIKKNPILAASIDRYVATMIDVGFTDKFEADKLHTVVSKTDEKSDPHTDRNTIIVLQDWRKTRGLDVERSESRSLNININVTEEQMEFFLRMRKQGEMEKQKEEAVNGS